MHVVIVGSGISGLSTAAELQHNGHQVTIISADPISATTSFLAAAVWFPTAAGPAARVSAWSKQTFLHLQEQSANRTPGVRMCPTLTLYRDIPAIPAWSDTASDFRAADADELPLGYRFGFRFAVPLVEMPIYLPYLRDRVAANGAHWVGRTIGRLEDVLDLAPEVVITCAGLRAGPLVGDQATYPIRGQIVRVTNPGLSVSIRDEAHPLGRAYVHPRANDCILGGTLDSGQRDVTPDPVLAQSILARCRDLAPQLADSRVIDTVVGLRPGRAEVRVELDDTILAGIPVVHNYGHGGSGITIGYGCAREVAMLVDSL